MNPWRRLYGTVWLAFFCCMLVPRWMGPRAGLPIHGLLGILLLVVTSGNARQLAALPAPARLQRISRVTAGFALFQLACGVGLAALSHLGVSVPVVPTLLQVAHGVVALAILAQASSVATAHDMWQQKECDAVIPPTKSPTGT